MKNKNLIITIVICVLLIGGTVGFLYWFDQKDKKADEEKGASGTSSGSSSTTTPTTPKPAVEVFPLKKGSKGDYVKALQTQLNLYISYNYFTLKVKPPYQTLSVDGDFGARTEANVLWYFGKKTVDKLDFWKFINLIVSPSGGQTVQSYDFFKYVK